MTQFDRLLSNVNALGKYQISYEKKIDWGHDIWKEC